MENLLRGIASGGIDISGLPQPAADAGHLQTILNLFFMVMGAIAVLIVVLAGFRFITSTGSPQEVAKARNAIIYAIIGLLVIIFATAIVNFVLFRAA